VLMIGVELLLLFRVRLGRLVPVALAGGVVAYIALSIIEGPSEAVGHLMSLENSRTRPWTNLWNTFLAEPLLGTGSLGTGLGENSYLSVAAAFGMLGLIPLAMLLVFIFKDLWRLWRVRRSLGEHGLLADLMTAMTVTFLFSFIFEAYLIGTVTAFVFTLYIVFGVTAFLLDPAWTAPQMAEYPSEGWAHDGNASVDWAAADVGIGSVPGDGSGQLAAGPNDPQYVPDYSLN
jgi:O-antigen ligase